METSANFGVSFIEFIMLDLPQYNYFSDLQTIRCRGKILGAFLTYTFISSAIDSGVGIPVTLTF